MCVLKWSVIRVGLSSFPVFIFPALSSPNYCQQPLKFKMHVRELIFWSEPSFFFLALAISHIQIRVGLKIEILTSITCVV